VHTTTEQALAQPPEEREAHRRALAVLQERGFEPMVGGAYALKVHTGIWRDTKDLDLFLRKDRVEAALESLTRADFRTEFTDRLWIAKAFDGPYFIDLIFSSGNGVAVVDEQWMRRAVTAEVLGQKALIVPAEEMIWQKAFIQERERFDGADIHHLLRAKGASLDWQHLLDRFQSAARRSRASRSRSILSSAPPDSPGRSISSARTSPSTATPTAASSAAPRPAGFPSSTWPCRCCAGSTSPSATSPSISSVL
jgi:hypothetical protein